MAESGEPSTPIGVGGSSDELYEHDPNDEEDPDGDSSDEESSSESSGHNSEQYGSQLRQSSSVRA